MSSLSYKNTKIACYIGYFTQAIVINLPPLLFVTFQRQFGFTLEMIGFMISFNFIVQMITDLICVKLADRIGYRIGTVCAMFCAVFGLVSMSFLPYIIHPYIGLLISFFFMSVGGGLIEVLITPIVESIPGDAKESEVLLLHSFYCWGQAGVVLLSSVFFILFGTDKWFILPLLWALIPFIDLIMFISVPLCRLESDETRFNLLSMFKQALFPILIVMMVASGASELAISQWSSLFAELGLGVSKTVGDLLGPCLFALLMAISRVYLGLQGNRLKIEKALVVSSFLCIAAYLITVFSPIPIISLIGCALTGISVGIMWPGIISLAAKKFPLAGNKMFAILAIGGDIGCTIGPAIVGTVSNGVQKLNNTSQGIFSLISGDVTQQGLKIGLLIIVLFPIMIIAGISAVKRLSKSKKGL